MIGNWPCPLPDGTITEELVMRCGDGSGPRLLIIPPLFSEHNLMRRMLAEVMRRLADAQIDTVLPDLPGWNESLQPLAQQTLSSWHLAMAEAARFHGATAVLAVRSGALIAPSGIPGWAYAPQSGAKLLRAMIRARTIASREAGQAESSDELFAMGRESGIDLAGWPIGPVMFGELEQAEPQVSGTLTEITQGEVGGAGLWLRAEPGDNRDQAEKLAAIIAAGMSGTGTQGA